MNPASNACASAVALVLTGCVGTERVTLPVPDGTAQTVLVSERCNTNPPRYAMFAGRAGSMNFDARACPGPVDVVVRYYDESLEALGLTEGEVEITTCDPRSAPIEECCVREDVPDSDQVFLARVGDDDAAFDAVAAAPPWVVAWARKLPCPCLAFEGKVRRMPEGRERARVAGDSELGLIVASGQRANDAIAELYRFDADTLELELVGTATNGDLLDVYRARDGTVYMVTSASDALLSGPPEGPFSRIPLPESGHGSSNRIAGREDASGLQLALINIYGDLFVYDSTRGAELRDTGNGVTGNCRRVLLGQKDGLAWAGRDDLYALPSYRKDLDEIAPLPDNAAPSGVWRIQPNAQTWMPLARTTGCATALSVTEKGPIVGTYAGELIQRDERGWRTLDVYVEPAGLESLGEILVIQPHRGGFLVAGSSRITYVHSGLVCSVIETADNLVELDRIVVDGERFIVGSEARGAGQAAEIHVVEPVPFERVR